MKLSNRIIALQIIFLITATVKVHSMPFFLLDDCENAELITVDKNDSYRLYSYDGTTNSTHICNTLLSNDIWLKFEAPSQRIILDIHSSSNSSFTLFGGDCSDLNFIDCFTNAFGTSFNSLVVGEMYFLKISSNNDQEVRFMLESVPDNNDFQIAYLLNPDTCFVDYTRHNYLYYEFTPIQDIYEFSVYFFKNDINQHEEITFYNENFEFVGNFEAPFRELLPNPNLSAFWAKVKIRFQSGNKYYVRLKADDQIEFCVQESDAGTASNDIWQNAITLNPVTIQDCQEYQIFDYTSSSVSSLNEENLSCIPDPQEKDSWYIFDALSADISIKGPSFDFQIYEYFDDAVNFLDCPIIEGSHLSCNFALPVLSTTVRGLSPDSTFIIRIIPTVNLPSLPTCPPPQSYISMGKVEFNINDEIENAVNIEINEPFDCSHLANYTTSNSNISDPTMFNQVCNESGSILNRDSWYTFTPLDTVISLELKQTLILELLNFEVYSGEIGDLLCIHKDAVGTNTSVFENSLATRISNLSIGETYYLRIQTNNNDKQIESEIDKKFCLSYISMPPSNDNMENAMDIFPTINLSECDLSDSLIYNNVDNNVWFKFEATTPNHQFFTKSPSLSFDSHLFRFEANGDTSIVSKHESISTLFPSTGYNASGAGEKAGYFRGDSIYFSIFNYYDLEIGREYLVKLGVFLNEQDYYLNPDIEIFQYQFCLKTLPETHANNNYSNSKTLMQFEDHESRQFGYLTRSIPNQNEDSLHVSCKVSNDLDLEHIRPEEWYIFTAEKSDYTIFFDNLTKFDEDSHSIIRNSNFLDSTYKYSIYQLDDNNQLQDIVCNELLLREQEINNLIIGGKYYIVIRMDCLNYLSDLDFSIALSKVYDIDNDGFYSDIDCDDNNPIINPSQTEEPYNGVDDDCNTLTLDDDLDQDGFSLENDCDDNNPNISPDQTEEPYNGIDDDCNSATLDDDLDQDGFVVTDDCDDNNPNINPNQTEEHYNGIDDDCNSSTHDDDLDQDGFLLTDDCDDNNPNINPDAEEIANNGIDEDCDGMDLISSIHEIGNSTINIFPNPTIDQINIDITGNLSFEVNLFDLNGRLLISKENSNKIYVNTLSTGTYLLEIKDQKTDQKIVERIIIGK